MLRSAAKDAGRYDIAIIGAGSAGCAAALSLLLYSPLRVVVMDRLSAREKPGETVPPSIIGLLEYLNTDESFYRSGHLKTYGSASAWGREKLLTRAIVFDTEGHGWHLDRRVFERSLQDEVRKRGGCLHEASVRSLQRQGNGWSLQVESSGRSTTLKTRFVLDASVAWPCSVAKSRHGG